MVLSLTVTNQDGESLNLELTNPWKNGVAVKSITGLGTPKYSINMSPYASGDGSNMGSVTATDRNIVITLYPLFNPLVEDSRQLLYRYFRVKQPITLTFELDNRVASIQGYIEETSPDIFSKRESVQISVICPDPYFREDVVEGSFFFGRMPMFEFPFSNESLTRPLLILSEYSIDNRALITYNAEIATGITIILDCFEATGDITLYNVETLGKMTISNNRVRMVTGQEIINKDRIVISTYIGDRSIHLVREGRTYDILQAINKDCEWFQIEPGINSFTYTTTNEHALIVMAFRYQNTYASI